MLKDKQLEQNNRTKERNNSNNYVLNDSIINQIFKQQEKKITIITEELLKDLKSNHNIDIVNCLQLSDLGLQITNENLKGFKNSLNHIYDKNLFEELEPSLINKILKKIDEVKDKSEIYHNFIINKLIYIKNSGISTKRYILSKGIESELYTHNSPSYKWNEALDNLVILNEKKKIYIKLIITSITSVLEKTIKLIELIKDSLKNNIYNIKKQLDNIINNSNNNFSTFSIPITLLKKLYLQDKCVKIHMYSLLC